MNEKGKSRKEWVKTAAIIFLSVLLVLTFFSNTIMNYSLPEVATQYVESGNITAKVRGTGVVESGDPYSVRLKTTDGSTNAFGVYEVDSVEVRAGDRVQKGDVLCHLKAGESKELEEARDALNKQILNYEIQILQGEASNSVLDHAKTGNTSSMSAYQARVLAKENEIKQLEQELEDAKDTLNAWTKQATYDVSADDEKKAWKKAQAAAADNQLIIDAVEQKIAILQTNIDNTTALWETDHPNTILYDENGRVSEIQITVSDGDGLKPQEVKAKINGWLDQIAELKAESAYKEATAKQKSLDEAVEKAEKAYQDKLSEKKDDVSDSVDDWTKEVENRQKKLDKANEEKNKLVSDIVNELNWGDTLSDLRENIAKLQGENVVGEITAPISGDIISVNVKSGQDTPGDGILFTIQPEGKGYTMQITVTNEQAKRLSVGDHADLVNAWRYDDAEVVLSGIKPNPTNPGQEKLLTFDVSGSVTAGQSLTISVGQRSAVYDLTVPNSAIREDNNGKFILTVTTKSTPLSNRYIATRVDVEVLASDDTRSAINAPLYGWEYVITTATAPVEAGKQVRLANNN
ncbi:MAG: HlyD family efflux transporter periplasmic adaptor subunit [Lachnospiraceae bacterium]|nr:HlyD family efflux transporter periplasmic adaptor subunit [Lachnospiraceae bacterium]